MDIMGTGSLLSVVLTISFQILLLLIGTFINIKIISSCKNEKWKTWQIDIFHSAVLITVFVFRIIFERISFFVPDLHEYTGVWVCYIAAFIYLYGTQVILFQSFVVSLMKYIFIVHQGKSRMIGEEKIKKSFLVITIIHPLLLTVTMLLTLDFENYASLISCFGLKEELLKTYNTSTGSIGKSLFCRLNSDGNENSQGKEVFDSIKQGMCAVKAIWGLLLASNIPEAYFYLHIFRKMRR